MATSGADTEVRAARPPSDERARRFRHRRRVAARLPLSAWAVGLGLIVAAAVVTLTTAPGWYVADARFEHFWDPLGVLERHGSVWDGIRTLGRPTQWYSPVVSMLLVVVTELGAGPAVAQRLLHAVYLGVGGIGMVQVLRLHRPRVGPAHMMAGLVYMFCPYASQFLLPSGLFLHYAVAPWLLTATVRGLRDPSGWRWPAVVALTMGSLGALNAASLAYAMVPAAVAAVYVIAIERTVRLRSAALWVAKTLGLTVAVSAAALVVLMSNAPVVADNLALTERPEVVNGSSSWTESWRGLGNWLTYFDLAGASRREEARSFFDAPLVVAATFALPVIALVTLARARGRSRLLHGGLAVAAVAVMVGMHPVDELTPLGSALSRLYDTNALALGFRATYKAGAGLMIGLGALVGVGVDRFVRAADRHRRRWSGAPGRAGWLLPAGAGVLAVAPLVLAASPFLTGSLYSETDRVRVIPEYWDEAVAWLDERPQPGRVLIVPGVGRARYRWGYVGDDIFDARLDRPHATSSTLPQATPEASNVLANLDWSAASGHYVPGTLAPIARRLGIRWVVLHNDLDWPRMGIPRPATFAALREDADLELAATFGRPGQNVVARNDDSPAGRDEAGLPPVEVYEVRGTRGPLRLAADRPLLVAGDGAAWTGLAADGLLDGAAPVRHTASIDAAELAGEVERAAGVVVTDSARRRVVGATSTRPERSHTVAAADRLRGEEPWRLFDRAGSEAVAEYGDARRIVASSDGVIFLGFEPWARAANAFDGMVGSEWLVAGDAVGEWVRADLDRPVRIGTVTITPSSAASGRQVTAAEIRLSDRTRVEVDLAGGPATITFGRRTTDFVEVRLTEVSGRGGGPVGLAEVAVTGLDLAERIRVPDDVPRMAATFPEVAAALARTPMRYGFGRELGDQPVPEERAVRRRFAAVGERPYELAGSLRLNASTPTTVADGLVGAALPGACIPLVTIDGASFAVRLDGTAERLLAGDTVTFTGCDLVTIGPGWHELATLPTVEAAVDRVSLTSTDIPLELTRRPFARIRVDGRSATSVSAQVLAPEGGRLVLDQAWDPGWEAVIDGERLAADPADTMAAWRLPADEAPGDVTIRYRSQRWYVGALVVSGVAAAACLVLVMRPHRRRRPHDSERAYVRRLSEPQERTFVGEPGIAASIVSGLAVTGAGFVLGGGPGAAVAAAGTAVARWRPRWVTLAAAVVLAAAAIATLTEAPLPAAGSFRTFVAVRPVAAELGRAAGLLVVAALVAFVVRERASPASQWDDDDERSG